MNYNKLKRSAEKITMPEDAKERIITRCHQLEKNLEELSDDESGYVQQVSGVEKAKTHRITKMISAAAACAVITGSVVAAAHFLKRPAPGTGNQMGGIEGVEVKNNPLSDFCDHNYALTNTIGSVQTTNLTEKQKLLFADFFNECEYGEWTDEDQLFAITRSYYAAYTFIEKSETGSDTITIDCNNCLTIEHSSGESPSDEPAVIEQYKVNFEAFVNAVNLIMETDKDEKTAPFGDMSEYDFDIIFGEYNESSHAIPVSEEQKLNLVQFLNNVDYTEWTDEDEAEAALSSYPAKGEYNLHGKNDYFFCDISFDITGCLTATYGDFPPDSGNYTMKKYKIDYDLFSKTIKQIIGADDNEKSGTGTNPFISFESEINNGAEIKYTLSDKPMPDLTEEQCILLDNYFNKAFDKLESVEDHVPVSEPIIKFEVTVMPDTTFSVQIYSDDYLYIKSSIDQNSGWYKYSGSRMHAEIETAFRNGSNTDSNTLYPPFGNLAKNSGTYKVIRSDSAAAELEGDFLHQIFYGYDWTECEITEDIVIKPAEFTFSYDYNDSDTNIVSVSIDGQVHWVHQNAHTEKTIEEHWYQLTDTNVPDSLSSRFSE